jgi:hypothetical protein
MVMVGVAVQNIVNYYFGRTTIAPQDVSQELFNFNLTSIIVDLGSSDITTFISALNTPAGQVVVARASPADQVNINGLGARFASLGTDLSALNQEIQASQPRPHMTAPTLEPGRYTPVSAQCFEQH